MARHTATRKLRKCPRCGSRGIARILYGHPDPSETLFQDLREGRVVLGGCCITDDDPAWQCTSCETLIYKTKNHSRRRTAKGANDGAS